MVRFETAAAARHSADRDTQRNWWRATVEHCDPDRLRDLYVTQQPVRMGPFRPEVLGGLFAWHGDDGFTLSAYFTSERETRNGENIHEFASFFDDIDAVMQDLTYIDLRNPWLSSA